MAKRKSKKTIPRTVKVIAILNIFLGALAASLLILYLPVLLWNNVQQSFGEAVESIPLSGLITLLISGIYGIFLIIASIGLLKNKNWGRKLTIILSVIVSLSILVNLYGLGLQFSSILYLAYYIFTFFYLLLNKNVKKVFK